MDDSITLATLAGVALSNFLVYYRLGLLTRGLGDLDTKTAVHASRLSDLERIVYKIEE